MVGVLLNIVLNIVFVWFFDMIGAAIAAATSELIFGILLYIQVKRLDNKFDVNTDK